VVAGVPSGCKRVSDQLRIVDNEKDSFESDDIPLLRVVSDPALDAAVVKTKSPLNIMPWKLGRSSMLKERNFVEVRGFPLGAFRATVQGRVTSVFDHDDYRDWNHDDFVVDAQLSAGNSGSPVLAVNCESGEYELVGLYHADYSRGNSLNVVVHIDQVRELMTTLKRSPLSRPDDAPLTAHVRRRIAEYATASVHLFLPLGSIPVEVRLRSDGALLYSVFEREFPLHSWPAVVIEDLDNSGEGGFGKFVRVWLGNSRGLKEYRLEDLADADHAIVDRSVETIRRAATLAATHRALTVKAATSRQAADDLSNLEREIKRTSAQGKELSQNLLELAERLGPKLMTEAVSHARPFSSADPAAVPTPASKP
jgi:serine protease Do